MGGESWEMSPAQARLIRSAPLQTGPRRATLAVKWSCLQGDFSWSAPSLLRTRRAGGRQVATLWGNMEGRLAGGRVVSHRLLPLGGGGTPKGEKTSVGRALIQPLEYRAQGVVWP